jgi:hypothetical protein
MKTKAFYLTTKILVVVVLVVVLAAKAFAGSAPKVSLVPVETYRATISIENISNLPTTLHIEDANGNVVYYKESSIVGETYSKLFDFRNLRSGDYKIIAKNKEGEFEFPFNVEDRKIIVSNSTADVAPYFEVKDGILKLSMLNHLNENVVLNFINESGVFFTKSLGNEFSITAGFNVNQLERGDYAVEVKSGKQSFSYNFEK